MGERCEWSTRLIYLEGHDSAGDRFTGSGTTPAERLGMGSVTRPGEHVDRLLREPITAMHLLYPSPAGIRPHRRLTPEVAAAYATQVDAARTQAATDGRTLVYTIRWL